MLLTPDPSLLLAWYDHHRRDLPWRARPGETPDPYRVWLSEIMLQQTTVTAVKPYFEALLKRFPKFEDLAEAPVEAVMQQWAGLGYYSRARNLHRCAQALVDIGYFPQEAAELRKLPGIGDYTAGAIAAIAFNKREAAVDGNVERVFSRIDAVEETFPKAKALIRQRVQNLVPQDRPGDFAQSLMDLGSSICTPKRPSCVLCPWRDPCRARIEGTMELYPRKAPKTLKIMRKGAAFIAVRRDGAVLMRTRPSSGLLGGMSEVPTSEWAEDYDITKAMLDAPLNARWSRLPETLRHVFTHFPLELTLFRAKIAQDIAAPEGMRWVLTHDVALEALSSLMKKVLEKSKI
jgi:A/G-specific adenine glycosylase